MKRILSITLILAVILTGTAFAQKLTDGYYFAEQPVFNKSGWRYQAVLQVQGGKIVAANWNAVNILGLEDMKAVAVAGQYGMGKVAKQGEWNVQAARLEAELVKVGDASKIPVKKDGKTDAVSGVSVTVDDFLTLVPIALAAGPVAKGSYKKDGWFYAKNSEFGQNGFAATALITIVNGRIVSAVSNGVSKTGGDTQYVRAIKGTFKMNAKLGEWNLQSDRMAAGLVKAQDISKIAVKSNGTTDAISGVSVMVSDFFKAAATALKAAQ